MRDYRVAVVTNGKEVLETMKHQAFDLVLMDIRMPEMDGLEATAEIRAREQAGRRIPIVAVTADAGAGLRKYYLAAGFNEYLSKPIQPEALYALIERWSIQGRSRHRVGSQADALASPYSYRRATTGSMRVARRAGIQTAKRETALRRTATAVNTAGSLSFTPNRKVAMTRVKPKARRCR